MDTKNQQKSHSDRRSSIQHPLPSDEPLSPVHGDGPHHVLPQMLGHLEHQPDRIVENLERRQDRWQPLVEPHIDDSTNHLADLPDRASSGELIGDLTAGAG